MEGCNCGWAKDKPFTALTVALLWFGAAVHLLRLAFGWTAAVAGISIPVWFSLIAIIIAAALAIMVTKEARR